jgi:hypothetical protein
MFFVYFSTLLVNLRRQVLKNWTSRIAFLLSALIAFSSGAFAQDLLLFGGSNHDQYLGCLKCSDSRSDSVCNGFGKYGNEYGSNMWNEFSSPYGNEFSNSSPWNEFSTSKSVPVLVDKNGKFYGYFTINDTRSDAVRFSSDLARLFKRHKGNLENLRESLCQAMN